MATLSATSAGFSNTLKCPFFLTIKRTSRSDNRPFGRPVRLEQAFSLTENAARRLEPFGSLLAGGLVAACRIRALRVVAGGGYGPQMSACCGSEALDAQRVRAMGRENRPSPGDPTRRRQRVRQSGAIRPPTAAHTATITVGRLTGRGRREQRLERPDVLPRAGEENARLRRCHAAARGVLSE